MIALDTNLLVRLATNDVPAERNAVVALLEQNETLVPKTVFLETEWVLRSRYGYTSVQVADFFDYLLALATLACEDEASVRRALNAMRRGLDFADALHLASVGDVPFATLDRVLHRKAARMNGTNVQLLKVGST